MTQNLTTDVATKSNGDDLADINVIILVTSITVIVGMASKGSTTNCALVGNGVDRVATHMLSRKKVAKHSGQCSVIIVSTIRHTTTDMK